MQGAARARVSSQCPGWVKSEGLAMSALLPLYTPKADIHRKGRHVAKVPEAEITIDLTPLSLSCHLSPAGGCCRLRPLWRAV